MDNDDEDFTSKKDPINKNAQPKKPKVAKNKKDNNDDDAEYVHIFGQKEKLIKPKLVSYDYQGNNSWVVPSNHPLLLKYNCHINVESVADINSVKYLFNYIHKGSDSADLILDKDQNNHLNYDEIQNRISKKKNFCVLKLYFLLYSKYKKL